MSVTTPNKTSADRLRLLFLVTAIMLAGALLVLLIDLGIKRDILKYATQVHKDIGDYNDEQRKARRADSSANPNGSVASSDASRVWMDVLPGLETENAADGAKEQSSSKDKPRRPVGRRSSKAVPDGDKQVGA